MTKPTLTDKVAILEHYIATPAQPAHKPVLRAIKADVVKANTPKVKKATEPDIALYNQCMGLYRQFMKDQSSHLKLDGKKAMIYKESMTNLIRYMRSLAKENNLPSDDGHIVRAFEKLFANWHMLNKFHQGLIGLPDIYKNIEEIIPQIKNGNDKTKASRGKSFGSL